MRPVRRLFLSVVLLLGALPVAADLPDWLKTPERPAADPEKRVWVVTVEPGASNTWDSLTVEPIALFVENDGKRTFLHDLVLTRRHEGTPFRFDRERITQVRLYTRGNFQLGGAATTIGYRPMVVLDDGQSFTDLERGVEPDGALQPSRMRWERRERIELHGTGRERTFSERFPRPVLAFAWSEAEAVRARDELLLRAARQEANRAFIPWDETRRIFLPSGPVEVSTSVTYRVTDDGSYTSWIEVTQGTISISIDRDTHRFEFSHRCSDTTQRHRIHGHGRAFCSDMPQIRVDRWERDPTGTFQRMHFGRKGISVFYNAFAARPSRVEDVEPSTLQVGIRLDEN